MQWLGAVVITAVVLRALLGEITWDGPPRVQGQVQAGKWYFPQLGVPTSPWTSLNLVSDERLAAAIQLAYTYSEPWRGVADRNASLNTRVQWGEIPATGLFDPRSRVITINNRVRSESLTYLSAVVAHEAWHGSHGCSSVGECLQEEIYAFSAEA